MKGWLWVGWLGALPAMAGVGLCSVTYPLHGWPIVSTPPSSSVGGLREDERTGGGGG